MRTGGGLRVVAAEGCFAQRQGARRQVLCLGVAALKSGELGQVAEARTWYTKARTDTRFRDYCDHQLGELDRQQQEQGQ